MIHIWSCTCSWFFLCVCLLFMVTFHIQACVLWFHDFFPKSTCSILVSGDCSPPFKKLVTLLQAKVWPAILTSFLAGYILYDIIYHDLYMKYNVLNSFLFCVSLWSLFVFRLVCCDFTNFFPKSKSMTSHFNEFFGRKYIIYHDSYMMYNVLNYFFVSLWSLLFRPQIVTKQLSLKISGISHLVNGVS